MDSSIAERTWAELGFRVRPTKRNVIVRTFPLAKKVGSLWLPPKLQRFYGELPHLVIVEGIVLAKGPKVYIDIEVGGKVCFQRLHFGRLWTLAPKADEFVGEDHVGYLDCAQLVGNVLEEAEDKRQAA